MNESDMDRYYWRTGQRWSGDDRPVENWPKTRVLGRTIFFLFVSFVVTVVMLFLLR